MKRNLRRTCRGGGGGGGACRDEVRELNHDEGGLQERDKLCLTKKNSIFALFAQVFYIFVHFQAVLSN